MDSYKCIDAITKNCERRKELRAQIDSLYAQIKPLEDEFKKLQNSYNMVAQELCPDYTNIVFQQFINDNFDLEPTAGPVTQNTVLDIYREWKRINTNLKEIKRNDILRMLLVICHPNSTQNEFWGIRLKPEL